ncbi:hypothetical protein D1872_201670 [compost metagenome]
MIGLLNTLGDFFLKRRAYCNDAHRLALLGILLSNLTRERLSDIFRQNIRVLRISTVVSQGFKNRHHIADRYFLAKQLRQYLLNIANRQYRRNQLINKHGITFFEIVDKRLCLLTAKQLVCVLLDHFRQMRSDYGWWINDGVSRQFCTILSRFINP